MCWVHLYKWSILLQLDPFQHQLLHTFCWVCLNYQSYFKNHPPMNLNQLRKQLMQGWFWIWLYLFISNGFTDVSSVFRAGIIHPGCVQRTKPSSVQWYVGFKRSFQIWVTFGQMSVTRDDSVWYSPVLCFRLKVS